jgi:hypothetical protein
MLSAHCRAQGQFTVLSLSGAALHSAAADSSGGASGPGAAASPVARNAQLFLSASLANPTVRTWQQTDLEHA